MNENSGSRIPQLFAQALDVPAGERDAWLIEQCAGDETLLAEVRSLLEHDSPDDDPLERGVGEVIDALPTTLAPEERSTEATVSDGPLLDSAAFLSKLSEVGVLSAEEIASLSQAVASGQEGSDSRQLASQLVNQGKLTEYQASALLKGQPELLIDKYLILDLLDAGGMGMVFKAIHRPMNRTVAVKMIAQHLLTSPDQVKRFQREVRVAATLEHPNIVRSYDADQSRGVHFLVMECVRGENLTRIVHRQGPLSVEQAVDCIRQAAQGLRYAQKTGVIHRDIKPGNLMLNDEGLVKVLDLGLANIDPSFQLRQSATETGNQNSPGAASPSVGELTTAGAALGTVSFMAPEQSLDAHSADTRADIYSLGCTLFYLLTGEAPYQGDSIFKVFMQHREGEIPTLRDKRPDVPEKVEAVCRTMLAKSPADRYQSMGELLEAIDDCGVAPPPDSPKRERSKSASGREVDSTIALASQQSADSQRSESGNPLSWLAALALLLTLGGSFWWWQNRAEQEGTQVPVAATPQTTRDAPDTALATIPESSASDVTDSMPSEPQDRDATPRTPIPDGEPGLVFRLEGTQPLGQVRFSPNGRYLAVGPRANPPREDGSGRVHVYDLETRVLMTQFGGVIFDKCFDFHPDGEHLVVAVKDGRILVVDARTGQQVNALAGLTDAEVAEQMNVINPSVTPDGSRVAISVQPYEKWFDMRARLLELESGETVLTLPTACSTDVRDRFGSSSNLMFGSTEKRFPGIPCGAALWDLEQRQPVVTFDIEEVRFRRATVSHDGRLVAGMEHAYTSVSIWDAETGNLVLRMKPNVGKVESVHFLPGASHLVTGGTDETIRIWEIASGREIFRIDSPTNDNFNLDVSPDGRFAASHSHNTEHVEIFRLPTREWLEQRASELQRFAAAVPDSPAIAALLGTSEDWTWSSPEKLSILNDAERFDGQPALSADGLEMVFASSRNMKRGFALWSSTRQSVDDDWSEPERLPDEINASNIIMFPDLSPDGLTLLFAAALDGGFGNYDLWQCTRAKREDDWSAPVNLGQLVNSNVRDEAPSLVSEGTELFFHSERPDGSGEMDLWVSRRDERAGDWSQPVNLGRAVNTELIEKIPRLLLDGRVLLFNRYDDGETVWMTTRESRDAPWCNAQPVPFLTDLKAGGFQLVEGTSELYFAMKNEDGRQQDLYRSRLIRKDAVEQPSQAAADRNEP